MSSGNLVRPSDPSCFLWQDHLKAEDYIMATYRVRCECDAELAAIGMAMEQSASTVSIIGYVNPDQVTGSTIRVVTVRQVEDTLQTNITPYMLNTEVYAGKLPSGCTCEVVLAIPKKIVAGSWVQWLNVVIGELPRLGFITGFQLLKARMPEDFGPGAGWGASRLMERFGISKGPLLCRSMRPAVGVDIDTMARLNYDVLVGGFHCVKDDELMVFKSTAQFSAHVERMISVRDAAGKASGEKKSYIATLICEPEELERRWEICCTARVDGVLVAPFIQGFGTLSMLARKQEIPILAHHTCGELLSRNPVWCVHESVWAHWLRTAGADWLVTSGGFGHSSPLSDTEQELLKAMIEPLNGVAPVMPILQGGKQPDELATYRQCCMGSDFMLIVASWVDSHHQGLASAAREFRDMVDA